MKALIPQALDMIRAIEATNKKHEQAIAALSALYEDTRWLSPIPTAVETSLVAMLDAILGDELASYYLYENPRDGRMIIEASGRKWPINTVEDIAAYVDGREGA